MGDKVLRQNAKWNRYSVERLEAIQNNQRSGQSFALF